MSRALIAYCFITSWPHLHHDSCPAITSPSFQVQRLEANKVVLLKQSRRRASAGFGRNPRSQSFTSLRERLSLKLILGYEF
jgi:hypothetical protein